MIVEVCDEGGCVWLSCEVPMENALDRLRLHSVSGIGSGQT